MKVTNKLFGPTILFLTALIWGFTFLAQLEAGMYVGPFTVSAARFLISGIILFSFYLIKRFRYVKNNKDLELPSDLKLTKKNILFSCLIGVALFMGTNLQQAGIALNNSPSTTSFISSMYVVLVPLFGALFFKRKLPLYKWIFIIMAIIGSYLISMKEIYTFNVGDLLVILCAVGFAFHILLIDKFAFDIDILLLTGIQFLTTGLISLICQLIFEGIDFIAFSKAIFPIMFCTIFASTIGFSLQVVGQRYTHPSIASVIMSLEGVFGFLFSVLLKFEPVPQIKVWIGCILIFISVILIQLDFKKVNNE